MNNRYILRFLFHKQVANQPNNYLNQIESRADSHKIKEFLDIFVPFLLHLLFSSRHLFYFIFFAFTYLILLLYLSEVLRYQATFKKNTFLKRRYEIQLSKEKRDHKTYTFLIQILDRHYQV